MAGFAYDKSIFEKAGGAMYEMDREQFGRFIGQLRRENNYTQKQLAERLYISDKAVSKWERGLSIPDVSLLLPLAETLGVTVTELLEGRRLEAEERPNREQVEALVQKAICFSGDTPEKQKKSKRKRVIVFCLCWLFALSLRVAAWVTSPGAGFFFPGGLTLVFLCFLFGLYFMFFAKEQLPNYFDENRINAVSDGPFRMNLPGVCINNSNWPHIIRAARLWCCYGGIGLGLVNLILKTWFPQVMESVFVVQSILLLFLLGLFAPMYIAAKKYE